ncbi:hypothetical protein THASP1DRAFT_31215 [Thamnocephalis sphaerospora]|uniref:Rap-GAP domain-containing protein n=1 Tax=Thamnocephalis sphaerospora TaxID=78915 RepID=A0A4P9XM47_9FUNG|nr:hypothetical protein THASP1DRAFT_31215 [Thamnocephalis sphaerospora]|eukprot:RKP06977.1 hypothetical protein THASP1DRAFT_31215 [Thamnocephalis sphaerospora]
MSVVLDNPQYVLSPTDPRARVVTLLESLTQDSEKNIAWFKEYFHGREHATFLALDSPRGPLAVSVIEDNRSCYRVLIRNTQGGERVTVPVSAIPTTWIRRLLGMRPTASAALHTIADKVPVDNLTLTRNARLAHELLMMDERQVIRSYKFGICYLKAGQTTETEMLENDWEDTSPAFRKFLDFIGERIRLKGWKGYRAGLDVREDHTGTHSVFARLQNYEVMFHVAPMLPGRITDGQRIDRKRHIGNDIVLIIFQDDPSSGAFRLSSIRSKQNHIICFVSPKNNGFELLISPRKEVPYFTPDLPEPPVIGTDATSREFLLHKLINGERASYKAPIFASKITRTRSVLLYDVIDRYL